MKVSYFYKLFIHMYILLYNYNYITYINVSIYYNTVHTYDLNYYYTNII